MLSYANGYIRSSAPEFASRREEGKPPRLALVVPCFNEEEIIVATVATLAEHLDDLARRGIIAADSYLCCVDDGSRDETRTLLLNLVGACSRLAVLSLRGNVGHQRALLAGLMHVRGDVDCCVSLDADLQDDIRVIEEMIAAWRGGNDVVLGVRADRSSDGWFKRHSATCFYRVQQVLGVRAIPDHADFRLLSATALDVLAEFGERNLFLRGVVMEMGLPIAQVFYSRLARSGGETKYTFRRMVNLALDGITSFTSRPLRLLFFAGLITMLLSLCAAVYVVWQALAGGHVVEGWASIIVLMLFLGGGQLMALGIVGEYIGRIYIETKRRPLGVVNDVKMARVRSGGEG